ncbi:hypothetical protein SGPA1_21087 [Streptomyces misionensis JCM 4497]
MPLRFGPAAPGNSGPGGGRARRRCRRRGRLGDVGQARGDTAVAARAARAAGDRGAPAPGPGLRPPHGRGATGTAGRCPPGPDAPAAVAAGGSAAAGCGVGVLGGHGHPHRGPRTAVVLRGAVAAHPLPGLPPAVPGGPPPEQGRGELLALRNRSSRALRPVPRRVRRLIRRRVPRDGAYPAVLAAPRRVPRDPGPALLPPRA